MGTVVALAGLLLASSAAAVGTRHIALRSAEDFSAGELVGVAVDSSGQVRAGFNLGEIPVTDANVVWSALPLSNGRVLLATGSEGRLLQYEAGVIKEVAKADTLALTSLVSAWGSILVGSLPGATIYRYAAGKLTPWLKLEGADHVFGLAFDAKSQVLYAATGPEGRLFRITRAKKAQIFFDAEEEHLMSVAVAPSGRVYVGAGDRAKLYQLDGPGRATVLYDFGRTEVRAIAVGRQGEVYAIANDIKKQREFPNSKSPDEAKSNQSFASAGKGTLYRFSPDGTPEQLLDDDSQHYVSLALDKNDKPYVGSGVGGRLYTVGENHRSLLVADTQERQLTALVLRGTSQMLVGGDPVVVRPIRGVGGADALWTSEAIDLGIRSRFGKLQWIAAGKPELSTRTGNTSKPDDTWSAWSKPMQRPSVVTSPASRYIQIRARFPDRDSVLDEVQLSFANDNLRAVVTQIDMKTPGQDEISGPDGKLRSSGGPITSEPEHQVKIEWEVDNPDKDDLRFRLQYQLLGTGSWFDILEPHEKLTKTSYRWNTSDLPEGHYVVKVIASDELSNPPDQVMRHVLQSHVFTVDNTPPDVRELRANGRTISGTAVDGVGPIARVEVAIAGTDDWLPLAPSDGVFDESEEGFGADVSALSPSGPTMLTLRVYDQERNQVVRSLMLR